MRILIEDECYESYLAKCYEALRTGLRRTFDTRFFGRGYPDYDVAVKSYPEIIRRTFPDAPPDLLITAFETEESFCRGIYRHAGIEQIDVPIGLVFGDYWNCAETYGDRFPAMVEANHIRYVFSLFPQPLRIWGDTSIAGRLIYLPPCFDPELFNDWQLQKSYDVGFLASGTLSYSSFYPERRAIHNLLMTRKDLRYLWAEHPGWQRHVDDHPLVGRNFSRAINSCRIFITTGGRYRNPQPKIIEALASRTLLMSDEPEGAELLGLEDGRNYVKITVDNVLDQIDYYLARPELADRIAEAGYRLALQSHSCYVRAFQLYEHVRGKLPSVAKDYSADAGAGPGGGLSRDLSPRER